MKIDITKLLQNMEDSITLSENFTFPKEYLEKSDILDFQDGKVTGKIVKDPEDDVHLYLEVQGTLILEDSISLEEVKYPISLEIDEKIEKNQEILENTLDILDILWQNIVLEVPLRLTHVTDYSKFQGDGWKLLREDDVNTKNNPFEELKDMFGKE